jgi:hypothetical protein
MGSTGDPRGESSLALYGPVTSSCKRGAGRKVAPARHDIRPALSVIDHAQHRSLFRLAVLLTGDADAAERWCWTPLPRCTARGSPPQTRDDACRTWGGSWWPGDTWPGITISETAAGGPVVGAGPPAASALRTSRPPGQDQVSATGRPAFNLRIPAVPATGSVGRSASTSPDVG